MRDIRPPQIVECLDHYVVGQERAKRTIAVAIRNRWRALKADNIRTDELTVQRYLLTGPRGSGKTCAITGAAAAIAAPFVHVNMAELATAGSPGEAATSALESLAESARQMEGLSNQDDALREVEAAGIILIDGIDRWWNSSDDSPHDPLEAAQHALYTLAAAPIIETSYGSMNTGNIMMFATGGVLASRTGDIPYDLHVLFPRRVEFESLDADDLLRLLEHPGMSPIADYVSLLRTEGVNPAFTQDGLEAIVAETVEQNLQGEDLGARRLVGIIELVLDELLYDPPETGGENIVIDAAFVADRIASSPDDEDLEDFIL